LFVTLVTRAVASGNGGLARNQGGELTRALRPQEPRSPVRRPRALLGGLL